MTDGVVGAHRDAGARGSDRPAPGRPPVLPDFPWDTLAGAKAKAAAHPGGLIDLSVGTPVDPTPSAVAEALAAAANAPGYPQTHGTPQLREAVAAWFARRRRAPGVDPAGVLPTIGSKELVAWLPTLLGLGAEHAVAFPDVAYPTYDVGARLAGATPLPVDPEGLPESLSGRVPALLWLNSPGNPTGRVLSTGTLRRIVAWAREHGVVVASDECYAELDWRPGRHGLATPSVLDPRVCDDDHTGLLAVYSLSKQSNLAGYRAAFAAGDPALVRQLLEVRKHAGMMMPAPVQGAMVAALRDDDHVRQQRERYADRRAILLPALLGAGFGFSDERDSSGGLYMWVTQGRDCGETVDELAERGILAAPGSFYGDGSRRHVRIALTGSDADIAEAAARLTSPH